MNAALDGSIKNFPIRPDFDNPELASVREPLMRLVDHECTWTETVLPDAKFMSAAKEVLAGIAVALGQNVSPKPVETAAGLCMFASTGKLRMAIFSSSRVGPMFEYGLAGSDDNGQTAYMDLGDLAVSRSRLADLRAIQNRNGNPKENNQGTSSSDQIAL